MSFTIHMHALNLTKIQHWFGYYQKSNGKISVLINRLQNQKTVSPHMTESYSMALLVMTECTKCILKCVRLNALLIKWYLCLSLTSHYLIAGENRKEAVQMHKHK